MRGETYLSLANTELNTVTRSSSPVLTSTPLKLREWKKKKKKKSRVFKATQFTHCLAPGERTTGFTAGGEERRGGGEKEERRRRRRVWRGGEDGEEKVRRGGEGEKGEGAQGSAVCVNKERWGKRKRGG